MKKAIFTAICIVLCVCFLLGGCAAEAEIFYEPETEAVAEESLAEETSSTSSSGGIGDIGSVTVSDDTSRMLQYNLYLNIDTNEFDKVEIID